MDTQRSTPGPRWSRRGATRLLGGGMALLLGSVAVAAPSKDNNKGKKSKPDKKKPKFRTQTRIFSSGLPIGITGQGAASLYPSAIPVTGFKQGRLLDVNVTLANFSHEFPNDVDVLLQAPNGERAIIMSDTGASIPATGITLTLNDQAAVSLSTPLTSGSFKPRNGDDGSPDVFPAPAADTANVKLATFNGIDPNGAWRLFVVDDGGSDPGSIGAWTLKITARVRK